mmetsp:Transcript_19594/g.69386  ORF Transcript_19594/g.69386 Transcript_19594/m.69386 type:complete len:209 (+) Transcript_19594:552-1178(+)
MRRAVGLSRPFRRAAPRGRRPPVVDRRVVAALGPAPVDGARLPARAGPDRAHAVAVDARSRRLHVRAWLPQTLRRVGGCAPRPGPRRDQVARVGRRPRHAGAPRADAGAARRRHLRRPACRHAAGRLPRHLGQPPATSELPQPVRPRRRGRRRLPHRAVPAVHARRRRRRGRGARGAGARARVGGGVCIFVRRSRCRGLALVPRWRRR